MLPLERNEVLIPDSDTRRVSGITDEQRKAIKHFMQGAVYCWVKNRPGEPFAVHDLMGGENSLWRRTPLIALYEKHTAGGKDHAAANKAAGRDLGWLVKAVLSEDKRRFEVHHNGFVNTYRWLRNRP
jgi:hypothetical protein